MEEVDGVVWGNIAAVARVPRQATWEPLAALCLWGPTAGYWEVEEKMSYYSGTSKCALSRSPWLCFVWSQLAPLQKAEGKFWQRHVGARCYSRPDGGQPFTRFTLASSCPRRSAQGAWLDDTAKLLCNCRREKPTIGISPSGAVASKDANNQLMLLVLTVLLLI